MRRCIVAGLAAATLLAAAGCSGALVETNQGLHPQTVDQAITLCVVAVEDNAEALAEVEFVECSQPHDGKVVGVHQPFVTDCPRAADKAVRAPDLLPASSRFCVDMDR